MHLHDGRKAPELRPAHEEVGRRLARVRILVSTDVVRPDRKSAHCRRLPGNDYAWQTVVAEIWLVVSRPAAWKGLRPGKTAAGKKDSVLAQDSRNGLVILEAVAVAHFDAGAAVGIARRFRYVG